MGEGVNLLLNFHWLQVLLGAVVVLCIRLQTMSATGIIQHIYSSLMIYCLSHLQVCFVRPMKRLDYSSASQEIFESSRSPCYATAVLKTDMRIQYLEFLFEQFSWLSKNDYTLHWGISPEESNEELNAEHADFHHIFVLQAHLAYNIRSSLLTKGFLLGSVVYLSCAFSRRIKRNFSQYVINSPWSFPCWKKKNTHLDHY